LSPQSRRGTSALLAYGKRSSTLRDTDRLCWAGFYELSYGLDRSRGNTLDLPEEFIASLRALKTAVCQVLIAGGIRFQIRRFLPSYPPSQPGPPLAICATSANRLPIATDTSPATLTVRAFLAAVYRAKYLVRGVRIRGPTAVRPMVGWHAIRVAHALRLRARQALARAVTKSAKPPGAEDAGESRVRRIRSLHPSSPSHLLSVQPHRCTISVGMWGSWDFGGLFSPGQRLTDPLVRQSVDASLAARSPALPISSAKED